MRATWNHNVHYHDLLLRSVPARCRAALDVGCGDGTFARELASRASKVTGVDLSESMIERAERLSHMDFRPVIERMGKLLRPGGVLAVLGLARDRSPQDVAVSAVAVPASGLLRLPRGWYESGAVPKPPTMSYGEVRSAAGSLLPGVAFRRLLLFRYLLLWRKSPKALQAPTNSRGHVEGRPERGWRREEEPMLGLDQPSISWSWRRKRGITRLFW